MDRSKVVNLIKELLFIVIGNWLLAYSVQAFILPNDILSGGVAGIAVALYPIFHIDQELVINILVVGMFLLGGLVLGKEFAMKTVVSSVVYPIFISVLSDTVPLTTNHLLASFYGGIICGIGIGLVFRVNASTGGMDVPPLILSKYTQLDVSIWVMIIDSLTILLGLYAYNVEAVLIGLISVFTSSFAINKVMMLGAKERKSIQIISPKVDEIREFIDKELSRGCTLVPIMGGYQCEEKTMILLIIDKSQYPIVNQRIHEIDPTAFMIVTDTMDVKGEGFTYAARI